METWFCIQKTESLLTLRADSSVPLPDQIPLAQPSFFFVPDSVLGECTSEECDLVARFLSAIAGHIMKSVVSKDSVKVIQLPRPPNPTAGDESDSENNFITEERVLQKETFGNTIDEGEESSEITEEVRNNVAGIPSEAKRELIGTNGLDQGAPENGQLMETEEITAIESTTELYDGSIKKPEIISKRKRYASTIEVDRELGSSAFRELDQLADIVFVNNNRYQGRLSRMLMEGMGKFTWNNGQTYKGTFKKNRLDGLGEITWNDGSTYEGEVKNGLRHGKGVKTHILHEANGVEFRMYHSGKWKNGKKHGLGKSVYGENDWYDGDWYEGLKTGYGIRQYPSGVRYEGFWFCGHRHGTGTMVWPNCDMYTGEWQWGYMNGWGKYTWNGSFIEILAAPLCNSYTGHWSRGQQDGAGVLELSTGATIRAFWEHGQKMGTADVTRRNGSRVIWSNVFEQDQVSEYITDQNRPELPPNFENKAARSLPVNTPIETMDFAIHIKKLFDITSHTCLPLTINDLKPPIISTQEKEAIAALESYWLKKIVTRQMKNLTRVYNFFALIFHPSPPSPDYLEEHRVAMLRFMLWVLLKNCGLVDSGLNASQIDQEVGIGFDPLDKVMVYEVIHYLLVLSWHLYVKKRKKNPTIPGLLGASFDMFMEEVVIGSTDRYDGSCLQLLKFVPLEPMYKLYKTFNYPLLIEDFCERVLYTGKRINQRALPVTPEYFRYILQGKNIVGADGLLKYVANEAPFFDFEKMKIPKESIEVVDLSQLGIIGMNNVVRCIQKVVPESLEPESQQPRGQFELSFLEFCDILANMAMVYVKFCDEFCTMLKLQEDRQTQEREEMLSKKEETAEVAKPKRKSQAFSDKS